MGLFLCYGKVASPDVAYRNEGADLASVDGGLGRQVAAIGAETPAFRLNSPGWVTLAPELIAALGTRSALRLLCRDRIEAKVPGFAPRVREFCRSYLDAVADRVDPAEEGEEISLPGDRFFAALLPLPSPQVMAPSAAHGWIVADLAFWDGEILTLIRFGSPSGLLPRQRSELESLTDAMAGRVEVIWLPIGDGPERLPERIMAAASKARLPVFGPYRAPAFRAPLSETAETL